MKLTLEFEDLEEAKPCLEAVEMSSLIWDWCAVLSSHVKHDEEAGTSWEQVRDSFHELMRSSGVTLYVDDSYR